MLKPEHRRRGEGAIVNELRQTLLLVALLAIAWLILGEARAGRADIAQSNDHATPIQREIERQRQRLSSSDIEERRDALMRLGNLRRAEASRAAAAGLNDPVESVCVAAAHALASLPSSEAASLLVPLLKDRSEFVRREAAFALGEARARAAVTPLTEALHDKKPSVRAAAAIALGNIGDETAVPALTEVLVGAGSKGKKSKSSEEEFVRRSAAHALGQIRSRAAVPALIEALENIANAPDTRREAVVSLGLIGDSSALPALRTAFQSTDHPHLAEAARAAIKTIERKK